MCGCVGVWVGVCVVGYGESSAQELSELSGAGTGMDAQGAAVWVLLWAEGVTPLHHTTICKCFLCHCVLRHRNGWQQQQRPKVCQCIAALRTATTGMSDQEGTRTKRGDQRQRNPS